jgi:carbonic anhydrase
MSDDHDVKFQAERRISGEHEIGFHRFEASVQGEGKSVLPATHRFAVLTCMDARIDAVKFVGRSGRGSDAHIIRNAGGRATEDAIRSLVLSYKLLGTREWYVVQHSHCGMALLSEDLTRELLQSGPRAHGGNGGNGAGSVKISVPSAREGGHVHKLALRDQEQSVAADVERIRNHPLVPADVPVHGYIYHVETGRFVEVAGASDSGARSVREVTVLPRAAAR